MTGNPPGSSAAKAGTGEFAALLRSLPDPALKAPLWEWRPGEIKAVIRERRRRFGVDDEGEYAYG
ncbi:hypothetical protein ACFYXL_28330 [Streptomyces tsukubensis]|uniref:hypothetical protein n=1 Tax=Streptomyces tsukubensis TaxID=83656 RepID=UPI0036B3D656